MQGWVVGTAGDRDGSRSRPGSSRQRVRLTDGLSISVTPHCVAEPPPSSIPLGQQISRFTDKSSENRIVTICAHNLMPMFAASGADGALFRYEDIWQRKNLLLVCLPGDDPTAPAYATSLRVLERDLAAYDAVRHSGSTRGMLARRTRTWMPPRIRHAAIVTTETGVRPYAQLLNTSAWTLYADDFDPARSHPEFGAYLFAHADRMALSGEVTLVALHNAAWWIERSDEECGAFAGAAERSTRPDAAGFRAVKLRKYPFQIVYRETNRGLRVVAVAHTSRLPDYWRKRS